MYRALCCYLLSLQHEKLELGSNLLSLLGQVTTGLTAGQLRSFVQQLAAAAERSAASAAADRALRRRAKGAAEAEPASLQAEAAAQDVGQQPDAAAAQARQQEGWSGSAAPPTAQQPRQEPPSLEQLAVGLLPALMPLSKEDAAAVREWTARVHSPLPPEVRCGVGAPGGGHGVMGHMAQGVLEDAFAVLPEEASGHHGSVANKVGGCSFMR